MLLIWLSFADRREVAPADVGNQRFYFQRQGRQVIVLKFTVKTMTKKNTNARKEVKILSTDNTETENPKPKNRKKRTERTERNKTGVLLLSHIPNGFYEPQMFNFFSQFGEITRLKLIRSKKTGRSRHFAFIEFQYEDVARIAADTMNNYLMFQKILKCKIIPNEQVKAGTFKNWQYKHYVPRTRKQAITQHNTNLVDPVKIAKKNKKIRHRRETLQKKLNDLGIEYNVFDIKVNESFVPPTRTRASAEQVENLRAKYPETDERCSDFEYSDDELQERSVNVKEDEQEQHEKVESENDVKPDKAENGAEATENGSSVKEKNENDFGVMVVDLDDPEITFKSPPATAKIRRRSLKQDVIEKSVDASSELEDGETQEKGKVRNMSLKQKRLLKAKLMQNELDSPDELQPPSKKPTTPKTKVKKTPRTEKKVAKKRSKLNQTM